MSKDFPYKVVKAGKMVAQASTLKEARAEAARCGGVAVAGRGYAQRNPPVARDYAGDIAELSNAIDQILSMSKPKSEAHGEAMHAKYMLEFAESLLPVAMQPVSKNMLRTSRTKEQEEQDRYIEATRKQLAAVINSAKKLVISGSIASTEPKSNRNPSSGAKQRARRTRGWAHAPQHEPDLIKLAGESRRMAASGRKHARPEFEAHAREHKHLLGLAKRHQRGVLPNPSEAHHLKEAKGQLEYAENLSQRAKAAHKAGKVKDAKSLWAQTLEVAAGAYENASGVPTSEGTDMRQAARKLREAAYDYLVK